MPDAYDHIKTMPGVVRTATLTNVSAAAADTALLSANPDRRRVILVNDSSSVLYILYGSGTASATNYTWRLDGYQTLELYDGYLGALKGIWVSATGAARITELT